MQEKKESELKVGANKKPKRPPAKLPGDPDRRIPRTYRLKTRNVVFLNGYTKMLRMSNTTATLDHILDGFRQSKDFEGTMFEMNQAKIDLARCTAIIENMAKEREIRQQMIKRQNE